MLTQIQRPNLWTARWVALTIVAQVLLTSSAWGTGLVVNALNGVSAGGTVNGEVMITADVGDNVRRVVFELSGPRGGARFVDSEAPFQFAPQGDDVGWDSDGYSQGLYTLVATPFRGRTAGDPVTVSFYVDRNPTALDGVDDLPANGVLSGRVDLRPQYSGRQPNRVRFILKGADTVNFNDTNAPFAFRPGQSSNSQGWDTSSVTPGPYRMRVIAYRDDRILTNDVVDVVIAEGGAVATAPAIDRWTGNRSSTVSGRVNIGLLVDGDTPERVEFSLIGAASDSHTETASPYYFKGDENGVPFGWDTTALPDGVYSLTARVIYGGEVVDTATRALTVENQTSEEEPNDPPATDTSLARIGGINSSTVSGSVSIEAVTAGTAPARVEFRLTGPTNVTWTESAHPYYFGGDDAGTPRGYNTANLTNGSYTMTVLVYEEAGLADSGSVQFSVENTGSSGSGGSSGGGETGGGGGSSGSGGTSGTSGSGASNGGLSGNPGGVQLTPGGNGGSPDLSQVGNGWGADATAIARWDVVPQQTVTDHFPVGVLAFHVRGIDRVEFRLAGGAWQSVTEMTENPRTGVEEYWVNINTRRVSDGPLNVEAVAYPVVGKPRALPTLRLFANNNGTYSGSAVTVRSGQSIPRLTDFSEEITTIYLEEGRYNAPNGGGGPTDRWVTVMPAPGANPANVIIDGMGRPGIKYLRFRNLSIRISDGSDYLVQARHGTGLANLWIDGCDIRGAGTRSHTKLNNGYEMWMTGSTMTDYTNGPQGCRMVRNTHVERILADGFSNSEMVVNCTLNDMDPGTSGAHSDVYQVYMPDEELNNFILYGIHATNVTGQGFILGKVRDGTRIQNLAIVDVTIESRPGSSGWRRTINTQVGASANHVLIENIRILDQPWYWRGVNFDNYAVRNSTFQAMGVLQFNGSNYTPQQVSNAIRFSGINILDNGTQFDYLELIDATFD